MRVLCIPLAAITLSLSAQQQLSNFGNLSFHNNATISVRGDFMNNGQLVDSASSVLLNGSALQTLKGTSSLVFQNLTLNNPAGATMATSVSISKELNISAGTFSANAQPLVLLSNQQGTARVAPISGDLVGNITMQRYLPAGSTGWRFLASPVHSATINDWQDDFITSGFPGATYPVYSFTSVYSYDESVVGHYNNGFVSPLSANDPIQVGKGFWCYIGPVPLTFDVTGPAGKFQQNFPVTFTSTSSLADDGWQMIGNPYPSAIDWNSASWTKTNINSAVYIWNPELQQFASYINGSGTNGGSNIIPSSQSFWVQANATNPVLSCNEQVKTANERKFLRPSSSFANKIMKLSITGNGFSDECLIRFGTTATNGYDIDADARKFYSSNTAVPSISSSDSTGEFYSVNSFPPVSKSLVVPVNASVQATGIYTITVDLDSYLTNGECLVIEDLLTGNKTLLDASKSFTCHLFDTASFARFNIWVAAVPQVQVSDATCSYSEDGQAIIKLNGTNPAQLLFYDHTNQLVNSTTTSLTQDTLHGIKPGNYSVYASFIGGSCPTTTLNFTIKSPAPVKASFQLIQDTLLAGTDTLKINNMSTNASGYAWEFGDKKTDSLYSPKHIYYHAGDFLLSLIAFNNKGCMDSSQMMVHVSSVNIITKLNPYSTDEEPSLFPNPSSGLVRFTGKIVSWPCSLSIFAADGKLVVVKKITTENASIDLSELAKGIYFYKLDSNPAVNNKLVIE